MLLTKTDEFSFILKPSAIHGVGVFAFHGIKKGTYLLLFAVDDELRVLNKNDLPEHFIRYCVSFDDNTIHWAPTNFGRMSIGWYLNNSTNPNAYHKDYYYFAARDIQAGEEITIDYSTLSPQQLIFHSSDEKAPI